jgi:hypothetical protein
LNILLAGDSFAAKWPEDNGWPDLLSKHHNITNVAQAGVGEYKILKQVKNNVLDNFDCIIVSHTSPSRVHTRKHPIHKTNLHKNCDLIYNDIIDRINFLNPSLRGAQEYFKYHYDDEYQTDIYLLIRKEIKHLLNSRKYISITHTDISTKYALEKQNISFSKIWNQHKGKVNHYSEKGNYIVYKKLLNIINNA